MFECLLCESSVVGILQSNLLSTCLLIEFKWDYLSCDLCKPATKVYIIFYLDVAEIADEVYMEVIVGEEDAAAAAAAAAAHEQQIDDNEIKTFMPIAWAAAYGKSHSSS